MGKPENYCKKFCKGVSAGPAKTFVGFPAGGDERKKAAQ